MGFSQQNPNKLEEIISIYLFDINRFNYNSNHQNIILFPGHFLLLKDDVFNFDDAVEI